MFGQSECHGVAEPRTVAIASAARQDDANEMIQVGRSFLSQQYDDPNHKYQGANKT